LIILAKESSILLFVVWGIGLPGTSQQRTIPNTIAERIKIFLNGFIIFGV
jgi:hypothetical protein